MQELNQEKQGEVEQHDLIDEVEEDSVDCNEGGGDTAMYTAMDLTVNTSHKTQDANKLVKLHEERLKVERRRLAVEESRLAVEEKRLALEQKRLKLEEQRAQLDGLQFVQMH